MTPTPQISEFGKMKAKILKLTKGSLINLQVAKDKAGVKLISTVEDCEKVLAVLTKPRKITPPVPQWVKDRYNEAHRLWFQKEYPAGYAAGHYTLPVFPEIHKSGGLTRFIINFSTWSGYYGNRINTTGRQLANGKWIKGQTRTGTGDTVLCVRGVMIWMEIKINYDKPSDKQLREQRRIEASGGQYHFVKTAEQFLNIFDGIVYG